MAFTPSILRSMDPIGSPASNVTYRANDEIEYKRTALYREILGDLLEVS
jgi:hypothetical protein